jgi:hypothetical protein
MQGMRKFTSRRFETVVEVHNLIVVKGLMDGGKTRGVGMRRNKFVHAEEKSMQVEQTVGFLASP